MSKIGDALSAVYREGASVMVGATLAFLGPLAGGSAAAAGLLSEARRIAQITGADTDVKVNKVELSDLSGTPNKRRTMAVPDRLVRFDLQRIIYTDILLVVSSENTYLF